MLQTTVGKLMLDEALPADMRGRAMTLDKKGIQSLFQEIAEKHPDQYRDIAQKFMQIGARAGYTSGGYSFGLRHIMPAKSGIPFRAKLDQEVERILDRTDINEAQKQQEIVRAAGRIRESMEKAILDESTAEGNPLVSQIAAGKGNATNLRSIRGADLLYLDPHNKEVPIPVLHSYSEGLRPAEFVAGSFGARKGVVDLKLSTADAGYAAKQLSQITHRLLVTAHDSDKLHDASQPRGMPSRVDDNDNEGAFLAAPAGRFSRNTQITPAVMADLKKRGIEHILVRSPTVGGPEDGGLYALDAGVRERGRLAPIHDFVGLSGAAAIGEPLSQAQICLVRGTLVRMADWSVKAIEAINIGDFVLGADKTGKTFPVRVLRTYDNGQRPCVRTKFRSGRSKTILELESTAEHKLLAATNKSNCAGAADNGKPIIQPVGTKARKFYAIATCEFDDSTSNFTVEPFALLIGLLLGDGCYTESVGCNPHLSCADKVLIEDLTAYLEPFNLRLKNLAAGNHLTYRLSQIKEIPSVRNDKGQVCGGYRNPAKLALDRYGMLGKYAHEKVIPDEVFSWDNASVAALIAGLFITDGSIYTPTYLKLSHKPSIGFGSTSRKMIEQLRDLLEWRFGIHASTIDTQLGERVHAIHTFVISDEASIFRFAKYIPLLGIKRKTLTDLLSAWQPVLHRPYRPRRKSQEVIGFRDTFDLEVDHPDHLFVLANGLIVSNSSKHLGGVAGSGAGISGFKLIDQLLQTPSTFPGGASHAQLDGQIDKIIEAPQGGHYIIIDGEKHYVAQGNEATVKPGQRVESGDPISSGIVNPSELVFHKGIGEGRRQFTNQFVQAMRSSGMPVNRRNVELIARGLIDHVQLHEEMGEHDPDDVVSYSTLEHIYKPRKGATKAPIHQAVGRYLEQPVLHYTIGTKVRPSVISELERFGVKHVTTHQDPPPFTPTMLSARSVLGADPDWQTRMLGSNLEKHLLRGAHRADVSDPLGTSYVPGLAKGLGFGTYGKAQGWDSEAK